MQSVRSKNLKPKGSKQFFGKKKILNKKMRSKFGWGVRHPRCRLRVKVGQTVMHSLHSVRYKLLQ